MTSSAVGGRGVVVAALALTMVVGGVRPAVAQTPGDPKAVARAKLLDGSDALKRGDFNDALARFKEAYDLVPSPKIHYNFGLAYRGLGRPADAIDAFEKFLADATDASPDLRANAERFRSELGQQVGTVVLTCDLDGAEISVDGRSHGTTPARAPLRLDPGPHQIVVEKAPAAPFTRKLELTAGERVTVSVTLAPQPSPSSNVVADPLPERPSVPVSPPEAPPPPARRHSWKWWAGWGGAAAGLGILGFGIAERMAANSKFEEFNGASGPFGECDADARVREHGGGSCASLLSAGRSAATKANVGFVVGGLLAAGGAVLLALTWSETKEPAAATAFTCAPELVRPGLACALRF